MSKALQEIEQHRRGVLLNLINQCTEQQQLIFKKCFSHKDLSRSVEDIVAQIPVDKLDSATTLCERTIDANLKRATV